MRKIIVLFLFLPMMMGFYNAVNAQDNEPLVNTLNFNIAHPGFGGEIKIAPKATIKLDGVFHLGYNLNGGYFAIEPDFSTQVRYYFNRANRINRGKSIYNNSGLFTGFGFEYFAPNLYIKKLGNTDGNAIDFGPIFGVQRTFKSNIQFSFAAGVGYGWDERNGSRIGFPGLITFGYMILPKKNK